LKSKSYEEIQNLFDNEMRRVNTFIPMDSEVVKRKKESKESSKGTEDELESDKSKKAESSKEKAKGSRKKILVDDEAELKKHLVIVKDDDIAIDAIPLATKPLVIVEYKLLKQGILVMNDETAWLKDGEGQGNLKKKTNTDYLVKEQKKGEYQTVGNSNRSCSGVRGKPNWLGKPNWVGLPDGVGGFDEEDELGFVTPRRFKKLSFGNPDIFYDSGII
ncbi:hypothetical protein Tco_1172174, partial [Tanacetum coccineum]